VAVDVGGKVGWTVTSAPVGVSTTTSGWVGLRSAVIDAGVSASAPVAVASSRASGPLHPTSAASESASIDMTTTSHGRIDVELTIMLSVCVESDAPPFSAGTIHYPNPGSGHDGTACG
jgi:hypothetical protein